MTMIFRQRWRNFPLNFSEIFNLMKFRGLFFHRRSTIFDWSRTFFNWIQSKPTFFYPFCFKFPTPIHNYKMRERDGNKKLIPKIREREGNEKIHVHNSGTGIRGFRSWEWTGPGIPAHPYQKKCGAHYFYMMPAGSADLHKCCKKIWTMQNIPVPI